MPYHRPGQEHELASAAADVPSEGSVIADVAVPGPTGPVTPAARGAELDTPQGSAQVATTSLGLRLEFLDALRGIAALLVVVEHFAEQSSPRFAAFSLTGFRFGEYGVVLFFLISGFIIPASLERRGSLKEFWIGRAFRLFPIYWLCLIAILVLHFGFSAYRGLSPEYLTHWLRYSAINATMLQDYTGIPLTLGQSWSLAYEMGFYLLVSVLFVAKVHTRSAPIALVLLVASAFLASRLPSNALKGAGPKRYVLLALCVLLAALATAWVVRRAGRSVVVPVLVVAVLVVLVFNRYEPLYQAAFFFGTLFFGTALYRWTTGAISGRAVASLAIVAVVAITVAQAWDWSPWLDTEPVTNLQFHRAEVLTYLGAYATFGLGLLWRHLRFPRALTYLGTISYSVYLVHAIVLYAAPLPSGPTWLVVVLGVGITIAISALTYQFVEKPGIALGRKVTSRLRARSARRRPPAEVAAGGAPAAAATDVPPAAAPTPAPADVGAADRRRVAPRS